MSATGVKACCKSNPNIWNMKNNKAGEHTQGEWKAVRVGSKMIIGTEEKRVCSIPSTYNQSHEERSMNALLIASAPKMLEALEHLLSISEVAKQHIGVWSNSKNHNPELEDGLTQYIAEAKAAIKAAKGE